MEVMVKIYLYQSPWKVYLKPSRISGAKIQTWNIKSFFSKTFRYVDLVRRLSRGHIATLAKVASRFENFYKMVLNIVMCIFIAKKTVFMFFHISLFFFLIVNFLFVVLGCKIWITHAVTESFHHEKINGSIPLSLYGIVMFIFYFCLVLWFPPTAPKNSDSNNQTL